MTVQIFDQFTAADATSLDAHTIAPTNTPATAWTERAGNWLITGNAAAIAAVVLSSHATLASGVADAVITAEVDCNSSTNVELRDSGIIVRWSDTSNYWRIGINAVADVVRITERNAGVNTVRASASVTITPGTLYTLQVTLSGASITATVDGANSINYASATLNQTATVHGIYGRETTDRIDDFQVETAGASYIRIISESVSLVETNLRFLRMIKLVSESVNISETNLRFLGMVRLVTESINISEMVAFFNYLLQQIRMSIIGLNLPVPHLLPPAPDDIITNEDKMQLLFLYTGISAVVENPVIKIISETLNIQENITHLRTYLRIISEIVNISETVSYFRTLTKIISEIVNIVESVLRSNYLTRIVSETANVQEFVQDVHGYFRIISETVNIQETVVDALVSGITDLIRVINETLNISESVIRLRGFLRITSETVNVQENTLRLLSIRRIVTEVINIVESVVRPRVLRRIKNEFVIVDESTLKPMRFSRVINEVVHVVENSISSISVISQRIEKTFKGMWRNTFRGMK